MLKEILRWTPRYGNAALTRSAWEKCPDVTNAEWREWLGDAVRNISRTDDWAGQLETFRFVLGNGVDPDIADTGGRVMLCQLADQPTTGSHHACVDLARELLNAGAKVDRVDPPSQTTALGLAVKRNHIPLTCLLLDQGARLELADAPGELMPLTWATEEGFTDISEVLRTYGATV